MTTTFTSLRPPEPLEDLFVTPILGHERLRFASTSRLKRRVADMETALLDLDLTPLSIDLDHADLGVDDRYEQMSIMIPAEVAASPEPVAAHDERRRRALNAFRYVQDLLELSEVATVGIVGVSRNTVRSWRRGERSPYPSTVRRLMEVESVLRSLVALRGVDGARGWLRGSVDGRSRNALLSDSAGTVVLASELSRDLFPGVEQHQLPEGDELDGPVPKEPDYDASAFAGPIRRRRSRG